MNIMIIVKNLTGGGAERVATNLATCLSEYENVILVVFNCDCNTYGSTVKTINMHMPKDKGKLRVLWHFKAQSIIRKLKKQYKITHAISFMSEPDLANVLSRTNEKIVISVRNKSSSLAPTRTHLLKDSWVYNQADAVVSLSKMVKKDLVDVCKVDSSKITPIYNPCYIDKIVKKSEENVLTEFEKNIFDNYSGNVVITAGRLEFQKGQWHLIRAFKNVVKKIPNAKLLVLGQGAEEKYLRDLIDELDLKESVYLLGYKSNPYPYLSKADLFAFSSLFEGLGNILVECMACKLPIVSADYPYGAKELLDPNEDLDSFVDDIRFGQYGVLVPPMKQIRYSSTDVIDRSEELLASAIIQILSDRQLLSEYKKKICERGYDFTASEITKQWLAVLENL